MGCALGTQRIMHTVWKQQFSLSQTRLTQEEQPDCTSFILVNAHSSYSLCWTSQGVNAASQHWEITGRQPCTGTLAEWLRCRHLQLGTRQWSANNFQSLRDSEVGINCLGSILKFSSPEGGSGQGMFVPEESGKEKEKPANTQAPRGLVFHEVSLMMSYKKWVTPTCDLLRGCTAPECL